MFYVLLNKINVGVAVIKKKNESQFHAGYAT